jgi:eukaryotic-like serine/threonine-protein kinase
MSTARARQPTPTSGGGQGASAAGVPRFEPDTFGKYYLLQRIGIGGMAEVIRAKTVGAGGFQKELVIKRVLPRFAKDQGFVRMFVNEAKITVGLAHPNIAQILELGEIGGTYFMAMELVDGVAVTDLAGLFRQPGSTISVDHAVWTVFEALKGLDYAHRRTDPLGKPLGIVHCDISPDNIMITFDAAVKVLDFGIARVATGLSNHKEGVVMGKVNYLSPEQAVGKDVDARSDVFAAGAVLYHLCTGDYPYGRFENLESLVPLVSGEARYVPAAEHNPQVTPDLDEVIAKAVALDKDARYPDARSFMVALEEILYPTPHSSIAEHLRVQLTGSFAEKKERIARLRSNDATVMRILAKRAEAAPAGASDGTGEHALVAPPTDVSGPPREALTAGQAPKRRRIEAPWWHFGPFQILVTLVLAAALAAGANVVQTTFFAKGVLVIESEPPGARVFVNNGPMPGVTPLAVRDLPTREAQSVRIVLDDHFPWEGMSPADGDTVQGMRVTLERSIGPIRVTSRPAGAEVLLNDELQGRTPLTLERVELRGPTKITLRRAGFELDEVVLRDLEAGQAIHRELERAARRR